MVLLTYVSNLTGMETTEFYPDRQRALDSLRYQGVDLNHPSISITEQAPSARLLAPPAVQCRSGRTPREHVPKPAAPPPIAGEADPEYKGRIQADQVTAEFGVKSARPLDAGRQPITDSPLFGGPAQTSLFGREE